MKFWPFTTYKSNPLSDGLCSHVTDQFFRARFPGERSTTVTEHWSGTWEHLHSDTECCGLSVVTAGWCQVSVALQPDEWKFSGNTWETQTGHVRVWATVIRAAVVDSHSLVISPVWNFNWFSSAEINWGVFPFISRFWILHPVIYWRESVRAVLVNPVTSGIVTGVEWTQRANKQ